ncbi:sigma-70 family RNA polymerase sigma factor [Limnochorda pilosa]|uniref:RNA polymerase sigma-70 region 2 domain-containing protein n=1 Tax=Limnochorda pilosa TaxID=1555112 RepID=A0A0K2SRA0_LIMPI|nr:sigma-70 family RNA polymerase sigma factor [Limnochorda pilosa]BAS29359.1 hypothetical protein LIP_3548 [Limnochorda pilosa]
MHQTIRPRAVPREEQIHLAALAKQGDEGATVRLIESCAGFVYREAATSYRRLFASQRARLDAQDLAQEGFIGILRALEKYDPSRRSSFLTYAACWVRQGIRRAIHADAEVATHLWTVLGRVAAVLERAGLEPWEADARTVVRLDPTLRLGDVETIWHALVSPLPLDMEVQLEESTSLLAETIPDPHPERLAPVAPEIMVGLAIVEEHPRSNTLLRR